MSHQGTDQLAARGIPEADDAVKAARRDKRAVGADGDRAWRAAVRFRLHRPAQSASNRGRSRDHCHFGKRFAGLDRQGRRDGAALHRGRILIFSRLRGKLLGES